MAASLRRRIPMRLAEKAAHTLQVNVVSVPAKPIINTLTRMTGIEEMYTLQVQLANGKTILRPTRF